MFLQKASDALRYGCLPQTSNLYSSETHIVSTYTLSDFINKSNFVSRAYGEIIHVKNEFISRVSGATGQVFGFNRDLNSFTSFLKQFYEEVNVAPETVEYVEGFGSGR